MQNPTDGKNKFYNIKEQENEIFNLLPKTDREELGV